MKSVLLCSLLIINYCESIERSKGALGSRVFTFVHGDDNARMNFFSANAYCRNNVGADTKSYGQVGIIEDENGYIRKGDDKSSIGGAHVGDLVLETSLASLHSYPETLALVRWISKHEKRSFWIGGTITKTLNEYLRPIFVLHWTDGSTGDFSFLRLPSEQLSEIGIGEKKCVSVDYYSGQWGVHSCNEEKYFVCLTVPVLKARSKSENSPENPQHIPNPPSWKTPNSKKSSSPIRSQLTADELRKLLS
ncbi:Bone marrow proteoglycan [Paragonimus heterotremus]|uniref:Bone marrow proteoglycan n=1 Tax=Paragonimus heterotremus TaxID=100268 RepID=A0A8J4SWT6_9TREM|nr:Bone marrow proteoglycan [Paragonimus heterotremus]